MGAAATLPQGTQRFGKYFLVERIGAGGMAEVFRAVAHGPEGFQRIFVVKRILPEFSQDPAFVQMFIDEAKLSAVLAHPNVVQVFEFGNIAGSYFIAMEHVHGRNLGSIMGKLAQQSRLMPPNVAADIARQVCLGLDYAHHMGSSEGKGLGIVHRDVTPSNVMVAFNGAVKVLDFGIARAANEARGGRTQAGVVKGKMAYLAPEQIEGLELDARVDIFALGIVLWEMLTGKRLFKGENDLQQMKMILEMDVPAPSSKNPAVPPAMDAVVLKALAKKRDDRYATAAEFAAAIEEVLIEMRHSSQALPKMLRDVFKDEVTSTREISVPKELQEALRAAALEAEGVEEIDEAEFDDAPDTTSEKSAQGAGSEATRAATPIALLQGQPGEVSAATGRIPVERLGSSAAAERLLAAGAGSHRGLVVGLAAAVVVLAGLGIFLAVRPAPPPPQPMVFPTPAPQPLGPAVTPVASKVTVSVDSNPQGAKVYMGDKVLGTTPMPVELTRGVSMVDLGLKRDGYEAAIVRVIPDFDKPLLVTLTKERTHGTGGGHAAGPAGKAKDEGGKADGAGKKKGSDIKGGATVDPFAN